MLLRTTSNTASKFVKSQLPTYRAVQSRTHAYRQSLLLRNYSSRTSSGSIGGAHRTISSMTSVSRILRREARTLQGGGMNKAKNRYPVAQQNVNANESNQSENPALFICDIQEKFRGAIWEFQKVVATSQKMIKAASILNIPVYTTTQNATRLGSTVNELDELMKNHQAFHIEIDKTAFSMLTPALKTSLIDQSAVSSGPHVPMSVIIVGIEAHICVTQTALDLLAIGHKVFVLADGVSSCNAGERPIALERLRQEGAVVTTSESLLFELVGDAASPHFKAIAGLVKDTKEDTRAAVETFCKL